MNGTSRPVISSQQHCHSGLGTLVGKHLVKRQPRPVASHTRDAFEKIRPWVEDGGLPIIFDSFCGTGMSTNLLAARYPDSLVLGIDKSAHRLQRHAYPSVNSPAAAAPQNYKLVRADCNDFWYLAAEDGWKLQLHFLGYPNPWPKPGHLGRRIHGAPSFRELLTLGGQVELRSNWQTYVEEFGSALSIAGFTPWISLYQVDKPISLFERKYLQSDHTLWRCQCNLSHNGRF